MESEGIDLNPFLRVKLEYEGADAELETTDINNAGAERLPSYRKVILGPDKYEDIAAKGKDCTLGDFGDGKEFPHADPLSVMGKNL